MVMTKEIARVRILREVSEAEAALDEALFRQSRLFGTLVTARQDAAESRFIGQDALLRLAKSQQFLLSAGNDLARVHDRLLEIDRETGDLVSDCPDNWRNVGYNDETSAA